MNRLLAPLLLVVVTSCSKGKVTPAPQPLRPPVVEQTMAPPTPEAPTDCEPASAADALPSTPYDERKLRIDEAQKQAKEGIGKLTSAKVAGVDEPSKEMFLSEAVDQFITALLADPYNVDATYNLAAAYAIIGRHQCSINMLERLLQMRSHPSKKSSVEAKLDLLLGRNKHGLDQDFDDDLRADGRFGELIRKAGTASP